MQEPVGLGSTSPSLQSASEKRHSRLESKSLSLENKFKSKATFKQGVPRNIAGFLLSILVVFVLATYVILIGASHLFGANAIDVMDLDEVLRRAGIPESAGIGSTNATLQHLGASAPYIPRIVHQTWKVDQVPDQWQPVRQHCMDLLPDFEFRMWSDIESRRFIQDHYPFFVKTWDSYPYNIQRADAIRYFVLHKYGGVYMDLDIGCRRHPEPLMHYGTILPITKPVGMSNDLMFSPPGSDFMNMVIHSLPNWNRRWLLLPYPTVIMSTGPLFISAIFIMVCIVGAWLRHRSSSPQAVSFDDNPASHIQRKFEGNAESKARAGFWTGILEILHNIRKAPLASAHLGSAQSPNYRDKAEGTIPPAKPVGPPPVVNVTLAYLPVAQQLCQNHSEVANGATLNATWVSGGSLTNTLYTRFATDGYSGWNNLGSAFYPSPDARVPDSSDDDPLYRYTFQTTVWQYQRGIIFTVLQYEPKKNVTLPGFSSKPISIVGTCKPDQPSMATSTRSRMKTRMAASRTSTKTTSSSSSSSRSSSSRRFSALDSTIGIILAQFMLVVVQKA
ncbi:hypothetical protein EMMF5_004623 [Cystobasidiomycetes sp. EMM_F5]